MSTFLEDKIFCGNNHELIQKSEKIEDGGKCHECEKEIDFKRGYYHCSEDNYLFHNHCVKKLEHKDGDILLKVGYRYMIF